MSSPSNIFIDPGSTDAIPVYLVVVSSVNTFLPRAALNDSSGNEITASNPLGIAGNTTVYQGTSPWVVNASISGIATVNQAGAPWLVNASVVGQQAVTATVTAPLPVNATYAAPWQVVASQSGVWNVNSSIQGSPTVYQGTAPWTVLGTVTIGAGAGVVAVTNVTLAALATVYQGTVPWLVNSSVVGQANVTASLIGTPGITATYSGPWNIVVSQGTGTWTINASIVGTPPVWVSTIVTLAIGSMPGVTVNPPAVQTVAQGAAPWTVIGSVGATQLGAPWLINASVAPITATVSGGFIAPQADAGAVGAAIYNNISLVATCVTIKNGNANLYGYHFYNSGSSTAFISLFAQTLATMGKTSATAILAVPAGGWADNLSDLPVAYSQGLLIGASASINGTGNPASPVLANVYYK